MGLLRTGGATRETSSRARGLAWRGTALHGRFAALVVAGAMLVQTPMASAATTGSRHCRNTMPFERWLGAFLKEARASGISARTIRAVRPYLTYSRRIVAIDRRQRIFALSFLEFSRKLIPKYRITRGRKLIKRYGKVFARIRRDYGVPAPVIVAFWGLESDFGANSGKDKTLTSLATLAYDCRRPELFRPQLLAALEIVERGDLAPREMIGSWAGELGQTQFLPRHYADHAVDYDGDGRRNLLTSVPDVLGSTARFLKHLGWRRGEPWLEEVVIPARLPWKEADIAIRHPRAYWARLGVTRRDGRALPRDAMPVSLLLPMGRTGPAFLAYENFRVYLEWNESLNYATTAAYYATRLAGAPPLRPMRGKIAIFGYKETKALQALLNRRGFDAGEVDGKLGRRTRAAVKAAQLRYGLPADSYPTPALMRRLRQGP